MAAVLALSEPDSAADKTSDLFDRAATQYQTSDYRGAVETYTNAYRLSSSIVDAELRGEVQAAILFNLARAHSKAYVLDGNAERLLQQVDLLEKYLAQTADLADQRDAEELLAEAKLELDRLAEQQAAAEQQAQPREEPLRAVPTPVIDPEPQGSGQDSRIDSRPNRLEIAGYTMLGLGVASGAAAVSGAVLASQARSEHIEGPTRADRDAAESKGSVANVMIFAGAAAAGVLVTAGITLAVVGRKRRANVRPLAWYAPNGGGLALRGRF
ncbi:MAG: hypothetical protein AAGF11_22560 [Myxococcota bacterium]